MKIRKPIIMLSVFTAGIALLCVRDTVEYEEKPVEIAVTYAEQMETLDSDIIQEETTTEEELPQRREITDAEYNLMVRVVMSETGGRYGEPMDGKVAVAVTILNRSDMGYGSISQVIYNSYSTADNGCPDESCAEAVERALTGQHDFPNNLFAFRTGDYHSFGYHYKHIGNHYFSCVDR